MYKLLSITVFLTFCVAGTAFGQSISGTYILNAQGVTLTLVLHQDAQGNIGGSLSSTTGSRFQIEGMIQDGVGVGACYNDQGGSFFEAHPQGNQLLFAMIEPGADQMPDYNNVKKLMFVKKRSEKPGKQSGLTHQSQPQQKPGAETISQKPVSKLQSGSSEISAQEVGDPNWGFKFNPPKGWKFSKDYNGAILGHDTVPGMILVFPHQAKNVQEMSQQMQKGLVEEGISLMLAGKLHQKGNNVLWGDCTGSVQGEQAKGQAIGTLSPHGGGAFILAVSSPDKFGKEIANAANAIVGRMSYFKLDVSGWPPPYQRPPGRITWEDSSPEKLLYKFAGRWDSATSNTLHNIYLKPDGSFEDSYEAGYSGQFVDQGGFQTGNWGATGNEQAGGRWTIQGTLRQGTITLIHGNGKRTNYGYRVHCRGSECYGSEYFFNGKLYSVKYIYR
jgi:hypothetical protein